MGVPSLKFAHILLSSLLEVLLWALLQKRLVPNMVGRVSTLPDMGAAEPLDAAFFWFGAET